MKNHGTLLDRLLGREPGAKRDSLDSTEKTPIPTKPTRKRSKRKRKPTCDSSPLTEPTGDTQVEAPPVGEPKEDTHELSEKGAPDPVVLSDGPPALQDQGGGDTHE